MTKSSQRLMAEARRACMEKAAGPFTPIVLEPFEWIGGERGVGIAYPSETVAGDACIIWNAVVTDRATP
jgi:hypothetical protein